MGKDLYLRGAVLISFLSFTFQMLVYFYNELSRKLYPFLSMTHDVMQLQIRNTI